MAPRRLTPAQYNAAVRKVNAQRKKAVDDYNRGVRDYNRKVTKAVNDYNREARAHNARVRTNRQRLKTELRRLQNQPTTTTHIRYSTSVQSLSSSFERVDAALENRPVNQTVIDLAEMSEAETANSVGVLNALMDQSPDVEDDESLRTPSLAAELGQFSTDLVMRWQGALFALSPANPDAARHFCTSAREIITMMIESAAPDTKVAEANPQCPRTPNGTPSRRAKVQYLLARKGADEPEVQDFVEEDLDNVIELFRTFNEGTHGSAGKYTVRQLIAIRERVESAIRFLHRIAV